MVQRLESGPTHLNNAGLIEHHYGGGYMKLTDTYLKRVKPQDRYQDIADDGTGITARIKSNGDVLFIWRGLREGKRTKVQIGTLRQKLTRFCLKTVARHTKYTVRKNELERMGAGWPIRACPLSA